MDRELIDQAVRALSIQVVLLRSASVQADHALLPPADNDLSVVAKYRAGPTGEFEVVELADDSGENTVSIVIFHFRAAVRLIDQLLPATPQGKRRKKNAESSDAKVRLEISAEFGAHYRLRSDADVEALRSALEEFGRCNMALHVWPYWREYVQSTCVRLGIPTIPVGMYHLPTPLPNKESE